MLNFWKSKQSLMRENKNLRLELESVSRMLTIRRQEKIDAIWRLEKLEEAYRREVEKGLIQGEKFRRMEVEFQRLEKEREMLWKTVDRLEGRK